jgi:hypothetical protein
MLAGGIYPGGLAMYQRTIAGLLAAFALPAAIVIIQATRPAEARGVAVVHPACPGDGDCCVDNGTPGCDDADCCNLICDTIDPFCCYSFWDGICASEAQGMCDICWGCLLCPNCEPEAGDCCAANGTPGCGDGCCEIVCNVNLFCCDICPELCQAACPWDLNGDGNVFVTDLLLLLASWGPCADCPVDFNEDGLVNVVDLLALIANFGPCPGSECVWDVTGDGTVDNTDLQQVLANFGPCDGCPEDVNGDGFVNGEDAAAVATHFGPCP